MDVNEVIRRGSKHSYYCYALSFLEVTEGDDGAHVFVMTFLFVWGGVPGV